jgi:hypothetical protein
MDDTVTWADSNHMSAIGLPPLWALLISLLRLQGVYTARPQVADAVEQHI